MFLFTLFVLNSKFHYRDFINYNAFTSLNNISTNINKLILNENSLKITN